MKILFVCSANRGRSVMAETLFNARAKDGMRASSAGFGTEGIGERAGPNTTKVLREAGFDISRHRSKHVFGQPLESFDLILAMDETHKERIVTHRPSASKKTFTLNEFLGLGNADIEDVPEDAPVDSYKALLSQISQRIDLLLTRLKKMRGA